MDGIDGQQPWTPELDPMVWVRRMQNAANVPPGDPRYATARAHLPLMREYLLNAVDHQKLMNKAQDDEDQQDINDIGPVGTFAESAVRTATNALPAAAGMAWKAFDPSQRFLPNSPADKLENFDLGSTLMRLGGEVTGHHMPSAADMSKMEQTSEENSPTAALAGTAAGIALPIAGASIAGKVARGAEAASIARQTAAEGLRGAKLQNALRELALATGKSAPTGEAMRGAQLEGRELQNALLRLRLEASGEEGAGNDLTNQLANMSDEELANQPGGKTPPIGQSASAPGALDAALARAKPPAAPVGLPPFEESGPLGSAGASLASPLNLPQGMAPTSDQAIEQMLQQLAKSWARPK